MQFVIDLLSGVRLAVPCVFLVACSSGPSSLSVNGDSIASSAVACPTIGPPNGDGTADLGIAIAFTSGVSRPCSFDPDQAGAAATVVIWTSQTIPYPPSRFGVGPFPVAVVGTGDIEISSGISFPLGPVEEVIGELTLAGHDPGYGIDGTLTLTAVSADSLSGSVDAMTSDGALPFPISGTFEAIIHPDEGP